MLGVIDGGKSRNGVAKTYSVSVPTIKRWLRRRRTNLDKLTDRLNARSPTGADGTAPQRMH